MATRWDEMLEAPEAERQKCAIELSPNINHRMLCHVWNYALRDTDRFDPYYEDGVKRLYHMIHGAMTFGTMNSGSPEYKELAWLRELVSGGYFK